MLNEKVKVHNDVLAIKETMVHQVLSNLGKSRSDLSEAQWMLVEKTAFKRALALYETKEREERQIKISGDSLAITILESLNTQLSNNQGIMRHIVEMIAPRGTKVYKKNTTEIVTALSVENDPDILAAFDMLNEDDFKDVTASNISSELTDETLEAVLNVIPSLTEMVCSKGEEIRKAAIKSLAVKCNLSAIIK